MLSELDCYTTCDREQPEVCITSFSACTEQLFFLPVKLAIFCLRRVSLAPRQKGFHLKNKSFYVLFYNPQLLSFYFTNNFTYLICVRGCNSPSHKVITDGVELHISRRYRWELVSVAVKSRHSSSIRRSGERSERCAALSCMKRTSCMLSRKWLK
ncbi:hypothetical protein Tcan_03623 [Toxocara canis]|uniref:Uncharacterized protein n=1 Tax=Toxocara canis TaxID=6265 RepID=A0A0B2VPA8_TOXCA|nr:hypothetical protein Tcan_03623 [Toxocara canis]